MKKTLAYCAVFFLLFVPVRSGDAQMMGQQRIDDDGHTAREEAEGKVIWEKLQAKEIQCSELNTDDFERLGEYYMGLMMGEAHPAMNAMMAARLGEEGEEAMHEALGRRLSGCDPNAQFSGDAFGFMPMMHMMGGNWSGFPDSQWNTMMNFGTSWGIIGLMFMILWWVLILVALVALIRWLFGLASVRASSALDTLKERYAKGEIDKAEFEQKKKDLSS